jgi:hypothetical protein
MVAQSGRSTDRSEETEDRRGSRSLIRCSRAEGITATHVGCQVNNDVDSASSAPETIGCLNLDGRCIQSSGIRVVRMRASANRTAATAIGIDFNASKSASALGEVQRRGR